MLTAEQRAQFDKAVKESDISKSLEEASSVWLQAESPPIPGRTPPKAKAKKKAAAGPKQHWGTAFDSVATPIYALGEGDPNYEADEGAAVLHEAATPAIDRVSSYKASVSAILDDYFAGTSASDTCAALEELGHPLYSHYFVKRAVSFALDRGAREKEAVALLLSEAFPAVVSADQLAKGFTKLLESAAELALDVPDAPAQLALFLARAVVDDVLPPAFLSHAAETLPPAAVAGVEALRLARGHLSARRPGAAVLAAWGDQAASTLADAKAAVRRILADYFAGASAGEACASLAALHVPFFAHEYVKKTLLAAVEAPEKRVAALTLLAALRDSGAASTQQLARGFSRAAEAIDDLALDVPDAKPRWEELAMTAMAHGILRRAPAGPAPDAAGADDEAALAAFKASASDLIWEYFAAGSRDEAAAALCELLASRRGASAAACGAAFVRRLVLHACDRGNREREAAAQLLAALVPAVLPRAAVEGGFMQLLRGAADLALDVPDTPELLLLFVVRAVVDDALPPAWPKAAAAALAAEAEAEAAADVAPGRGVPIAVPAAASANANGNGRHAKAAPPPSASSGAEVARAAAAALGARHVAERALRAWGGPDAGTCAAAKAALAALVEEFLASRDSAEAQRRLRELNLPFFGHELVKRACVAAIEQGGAAPDALLALMRELRDSGAVSATQFEAGFARAAEAVDDLALDVPDAKTRWAALAAAAQQSGLLRAPAA